MVILVIIVIVFIVLSWSVSQRDTELSIDWNEALLLLEKNRALQQLLESRAGHLQSSKSRSKQDLTAFRIPYESLLRRLYYHAIREGRKELAEALWEKGRLDKKERRAKTCKS